MDDHVKGTIAVYNSIAAQYAVQAEAHAPEPEREKFVQMIPKGGNVLDAGCGSGRDSAYFEHYGLEVTGIDLCEPLLAIARKVAFNAEFINQDLRKINFPENSFDGIWACASLLHLKHHEIPPVLSTFFKILKPGGVLLILVKAGTTDKFTIEPSIPDKARYYSYFSKDEIKEYVINAKFSLGELYTYNEVDRFSDGYPTDWIACFAKKPLV
jgi:ubiquinone/menaquinone biosynthesis C-methylase UbiE